MGEQTAGPLPPGVPRQGATPQRLCLRWGGTRALSSSFLQMAHLPRPLDVSSSSLLSHKTRNRERKAFQAPRKQAPLGS